MSAFLKGRQNGAPDLSSPFEGEADPRLLHARWKRKADPTEVFFAFQLAIVVDGLVHDHSMWAHAVHEAEVQATVDSLDVLKRHGQFNCWFRPTGPDTNDRAIEQL